MSDLHLNFIIRRYCAVQSDIYLDCTLLKYAQTVSPTVNNPLQCFQLFQRMFLSSLIDPYAWTCALFVFFAIMKKVNNMSHFTDKFTWEQGSSALVLITMFRLISSTIINTSVICTGLWEPQINLSWQELWEGFGSVNCRRVQYVKVLVMKWVDWVCDVAIFSSLQLPPLFSTCHYCVLQELDNWKHQ